MDIEGARMRYLRRGSGPALILLHGLLGYSFSWRTTIPALAPYATVYAPDLLGAGFSDRPAGLDYSLRATAKRVLRFISQLQISSFDLLGTSHGGAVAMMVADECLRTHASPVLRRLLLAEPVNPYSGHGQRLAPFAGSRFGSILFRFGIMRIKFLYPYWHARMYADVSKIPADALKGYLAPLAKPGLLDRVLSILSTWKSDLRELELILPKLADVPTLLLWGGADRIVYPSSAQGLRKYFQKSELVILPGVGHLPYEESPEDFNRALMKYLA
jgi:pimeloyl-ACP methyl ester carboxylesterase